LVNPFDTEQVVGALRQALTMPLGERKRRWLRMIDHLRSHDVTAWRASFLDALRNCDSSAPHAASEISAQAGGG
ncbi:MAG TPA: trehalose-6-phosphate synthase, partial [Casimicrobiaceae bacterium]|nr:trehalose-6-phosphate synthase [Casimicrobiaceae bacterium]